MIKNKLVFWIILYNAFYKILKTTGKFSGKEIYTASDIYIANETFSLDEIEQGILKKIDINYLWVCFQIHL